MSSILLVEDDAALASLVVEYLEQHGLTVSVEARGDRAVARILSEEPALVILDVMLPGEDGLSICRQVRARFAGPILMASARGEPIDQIIGLEVGADDYLPKPLHPRLLLARIRAHLRRRRKAPPEAVSVGALTLDRSARSSTLGGAPLELTTGEFELLWVLAASAGQVVDRDALYQAVRGTPYNGIDRTVDVLVSRLRRKLGSAMIKTVRGEGYQLVRPRP